MTTPSPSSTLRRTRQRPQTNRRVIARSPGERHRTITETIRERQSKDPALFRIGPIPVDYGPLLIVILIAAAFLRFAGIDWGFNYYLHPDENFLTQVVTRIQWPSDLKTYFDSSISPLNPYNNEFSSYVYGTFPIFLDKLLGTITGNTAYGNAHLPARWISAVFDLGTIAFAAWAARMLFSRTASIFTAVFLAFAALMIQTAHYATTDSVVVGCVTMTLAFSVKATKSPRAIWFALAGIALGLSAASKPNALAAVGFLGMPLLEMIRLHGWGSLFPRVRETSDRVRRNSGFIVLLGTFLALVVGAFTFRIAQPYAFTGPSIWNFRLDQRWLDALSYWSEAQSGILDYPPSIQWADRTPVLFMVDNMVKWGMAPGFGLIALVALIVVGVRIVFARRWPHWWTLGLAGWSAFHILYYGTNFVPSQRYILPAYPAMGILAGAFVASMIAWAKRRGGVRFWKIRLAWPESLPKWLHPGFVIPALAIIVTMLYGTAFANIYLKPITRVEASEWIYANIPAGSTLSSEYWDSGLPVCIPGEDCSAYNFTQLALYDDDNVEKLNRVVSTLEETDYVILSSRRLIDSIGRMPYRWPMATAYYDALFDGELGFELVATFESPPSLGPISIDDSSAEESLTVYEHPQVYIFKKSESWDASAAYTLLDDALQTGLGNDAGVNIRPVLPSPWGQLLDAADISTYFSAGTWSDIFHPGNLMNRWPIIAWYVVLQIFALPIVPLLWRWLPGLPDRGYGIAKAFGLVAVSYLAWLIASLRIIEFGIPAIVAAWVIVFALGILAVYRHVGSFVEHLRRAWLWIVATELLLIAGFAFAVWVRTQNPDLWNQIRGGDKFSNLAVFNAIIRSPYFPPYDPWFSGGTVNGDYWGMVPFAVITRLTGILPATAYNLAVASVFALLVVNSWSIAGALFVRLRNPLASIRDHAKVALRGALLALFAPLLIALLGNLQLVRMLGQGMWGAEPAPADWPDLGGFGAIAWGFRNLIVKLPELPIDAYWSATTALDDVRTDFPYFGLIFGDLDPRYTALPILTLLIAIIVAVVYGISPDGVAYRQATRPGMVLAAFGGWKNGILLGGLAGFVLGMLRATNEWSYLPMLALVAGAGVVVAGTYTSWRSGWVLLRDALAFTAIAAAASIGFWITFLGHTASLEKTYEAASDQTAIIDMLSLNGVILFAVASYLGLEIARMAHDAWGEGSLGRSAGMFGLVIGLACFVIGWTTDLAVVILALMLVVIVIVAWYHQYERGHLLLLGMGGLGIGMLMVPDWMQRAAPATRADTIENYGAIAWVLLGIVGAVGIARVLDAFARQSFDDVEDAFTAPDDETAAIAEVSPERSPWIWLPRAGEAVWVIALAALVVMGGAYPVLASSLRFDDRIEFTDDTLDGFAYMDTALIGAATTDGGSTTVTLRNDRTAAEWLNENVDGLPIILEAHTTDGGWGGRISAMTGLPTVLGWSNLEREERDTIQILVNNREADVQTIYGSLGDFASVRELLDRYGVELIYVGMLERATYGETALAKFDEGVELGALTPIYQQDDVVIYRYDDQFDADTATDDTDPSVRVAPTATPDASPDANVATPAASPEAAGVFPVVGPDGITPIATSATPDASPEAASVGTPVTTAATPTTTASAEVSAALASPGADLATPEASPETTPDATPGTAIGTPIATPSITSEATPETIGAASASPATTSDATPGTAVGTPIASIPATPVASPAASPNASPVASPEATPGATPSNRVLRRR